MTFPFDTPLPGMAAPEPPADEFSDIVGTPMAGPRRKARAVPSASIIALAQKAFDGVPDPDRPGEVTHTMKYTFAEGDPRRDAFVTQMRSAGPYTTPPCSLSVNTGPKDGDHLTVRWTAGRKRGKPASAPAA